VEAAQANDVRRVLFVSSDKAVDPMNFYGISKLAAERLMIAANQDGSRCRFIIYRAGNVMGSAGSVIPVFQQQLVRFNTLTLTDPKMTRFFTSKPTVDGRPARPARARARRRQRDLHSEDEGGHARLAVTDHDRQFGGAGRPCGADRRAPG
jgi:hypothetical protein